MICADEALRSESAICRKMFHYLWASIDKGWCTLTPAVQDRKVI